MDQFVSRQPYNLSCAWLACCVILCIGALKAAGSSNNNLQEKELGHSDRPTKSIELLNDAASIQGVLHAEQHIALDVLSVTTREGSILWQIWVEFG